MNLNITYSQRIAQTFRRLDPWNIDRGKDWYKDAHSEAVNLAIIHHISVGKAAGIIAVLSPNSKWERNVQDAYAICNDPDNAIVTTYTANRRKAVKILSESGDYEQYIRGKKVRSFYTNILSPDNTCAVTLDRHMIRFILRTQEDKELNKVFSSKKKYERLAEEIRRKAIREGLKPCQLQAMLWLQIRP